MTEVLSPPSTEPTANAYGTALRRFIETNSRESRLELSVLAREMATQHKPVTEAWATLWDTARPMLLAADQESRAGLLVRILESEQVLAEKYDQSVHLDRRAHLRLASAYAQKTREVNTFLDSLPAFTFLKDGALRYSSANREFCDAIGLSGREVISKTDFDFFPEEVALRLADHDRQVMQRLEPIRQEDTFEFGGARRTILFIKAPVMHPNGSAAGLIGVGFDLTERKRIDSERARLAAALESIGEAVIITDPSGVIQYVNPAFEAVTGYTRNEVINENLNTLEGYQGSGLDPQMWNSLARGEVWHGTVKHRKKGGTAFDAEQTVSPVRDASGGIVSYVAVARDLTEEKRMIEAVRRAAMVKSEFTSMVSHELRTPLTAIKEAIDVVADETAGPVNEHQANFLALAKRNVDRLHRLINDTLDFSKLERGEFRLDRRVHNLNSLAQEIVQQQRLAAKTRGLRLEFSPDETLPQVYLDPDRISQVLVNLIGNAIRYCEGEWIRVRTGQRDEQALVEIQDSGPGIPGDKLEHIFDAFVQLSTGPGRKVGGTGLGLAICKKLIELHEGNIWVESQMGKGSTFAFTIPLMTPEHTFKEPGHAEEEHSDRR